MYKRGKCWYSDFWYEGKRYTQSLGPVSKTVAKDKDRKFRTDVSEGRYQKLKTPTVAKYADKWLQDKANIHKFSTHKSYSSLITKYIKPILGHFKVSELKIRTVKDMVNGLNSTHPKTIKNILRCLSSMITACEEDGLLPVGFKNPCFKPSRYVKPTKSEIDPFTETELQLFLDTCKELYLNYYPLFLTLAGTGIRLGECLGLYLGDPDFVNTHIKIERTVYRGHIQTPKNGKSRIVDMGPGLAMILKGMVARRKQELFKKGLKPYDGDFFLFATENEKPLGESNLRLRVFHRVLSKAGLRRWRIHDIRHSYATIRLNKGHNIADVSNQLGHSSINTTLDTYYHWLPGGKKGEIEELDNALLGNGVPSDFTTPTHSLPLTKSQALDK